MAQTDTIQAPVIEFLYKVLFDPTVQQQAVKQTEATIRSFGITDDNVVQALIDARDSGGVLGCSATGAFEEPFRTIAGAICQELTGSYNIIW